MHGRLQRLGLPPVLLVVAATALAGCSGNLARQLLDSGASGSGPPPLMNSLAAPPPDTLQAASSTDNAAGGIEESDLGPSVPTLTELSNQPVDGVDAPKLAAALETDIETKAVAPGVTWRGKKGADGIDLVNRDGTLCSGSLADSHTENKIRVACSDGRSGWVHVGNGGKSADLQLGAGSAERVDIVVDQ